MPAATLPFIDHLIARNVATGSLEGGVDGGGGGGGEGRVSALNDRDVAAAAVSEQSRWTWWAGLSPAAVA